ncbi:MAG: dihydroorotase [Deltaproteobacteria bacterium]|jgi:dihydroorotase|nr:dihydroorotase [Deltaproteobacteria bacterium]
MQLWIKGGRIIDPENRDAVADILIADGKIAEIVDAGSADTLAGGMPPADIRTIDASGKFVTPGLVDMHVHLREPGYEHKETVESGCRAAARGGFTDICCMPNTNPANDSAEVTEFIKKKSKDANCARVFPVGAITKALQGEALCDFGELKAAGVVAVSDDGMPVMNDRIMRRALESAKRLSLLVICHCEDLKLTAGGVMNAGHLADQMGLPGISNASESVMVERDIGLCERFETPLHIAHVSTAESVQAIRKAKSRGIMVTCETAPHYFTLTEEAVREYESNAKMNPPLRSRKDREAIREGLADGTIDAIATDHAPHAVFEKATGFNQAPNGIIGLETSVALGLKLVDNGVIGVVDLIEKMSTAPAKILGLAHGLKVGHRADITIIDPDASYRVNAESFESLSRNTPFDGWPMRGKPVMTIVAGNIVFEEG